MKGTLYEETHELLWATVQQISVCLSEINVFWKKPCKEKRKENLMKVYFLHTSYHFGENR